MDEDLSAKSSFYVSSSTQPKFIVRDLIFILGSPKTNPNFFFSYLGSFTIPYLCIGSSEKALNSLVALCEILIFIPGSLHSRNYTSGPLENPNVHRASITKPYIYWVQAVILF